MFVRLREVRVGLGRYPLEGGGPATLVYAVSAVRPALLAQGFPRPAAALPTSQNMTFSI